MFYRQLSSSSALESLPPEAVVFFDGLAAVKSDSGEWLITGEKTPVTSTILESMAPVFHVISEFSFFPESGFDSHRVNLTNVTQFISKYGELPWVVVFEWTRDFFGVDLETARDAVWHLVRTGKVQPTDKETLILPR
jgi:hypothetical protein